MASGNETMERFAHDVCVHVLEKFGIFKAPDDTRKQNKYIHYDFLPRISRSVVSFAIWIRTHFKNALEDKFKIVHLDDNEVMWIFEDQLLQSAEFSIMHWAEKVCVSLALCTEYVQFASTKDLRVSLNKLVIGWNKFLEKHLRSQFKEDFVFLALYDYLEVSQMCQLGEFQEAFISEYCLPYGKIECTMELAKECMEKRGLNISLDRTIFGIKTLSDIDEGFFKKMGQAKLRNFFESEESKFEETCYCTSDLERDSSSTFVDSVIEASPDLVTQTSSKSPESETDKNEFSKLPEGKFGPIVYKFSKFLNYESGASDASKSPSKLPTRESVPSDAQSGSTSKSPERESGSSEVSKSPSKSQERESVPSDAQSQQISKSPERETGTSNDLKSSKSIEHVSGSNEVSRPSSKSPEGKSSQSDIQQQFPKSSESESAQSEACLSSSKPPEDESAPGDIPWQFPRSAVTESAINDVCPSSSKSHEDESAQSDIPQQFPKFSEGESASSEACLSSSKLSEGDSAPGDVPHQFSKTSGGESAPSDACPLSSKSQEEESAPGDVPQQFSKSSEGRSAPIDAPGSITTSPVRESVPSDACSQGPPETKDEMREKVDQILTRLEKDMDELRNLLFDNGLLEMKPGRRGSIRMRVINPRDKQPPPGPEGLI